ncbi:hypothetical protein WM04_13460 [Burkholderia ubonensis]|nr:hypothetical protein WM04_13460 [Burkholderia ubonensis]
MFSLSPLSPAEKMQCQFKRGQVFWAVALQGGEKRKVPTVKMEEQSKQQNVRLECGQLEALSEACQQASRTFRLKQKMFAALVVRHHPVRHATRRFGAKVNVLFIQQETVQNMSIQTLPMLADITLQA